MSESLHILSASKTLVLDPRRTTAAFVCALRAVPAGVSDLHAERARGRFAARAHSTDARAGGGDDRSNGERYASIWICASIAALAKRLARAGWCITS